jgi:dTDP-N-acetylfucosamine:lipid II N-acetylfucosaminyltransferase
VIAHIALDEGLLNYSIDQFETIWPGRNRFYIMAKESGESLSKIECNEATEVVGIQSPKDLQSLASRIHSAELVVIHRMEYLFSRLVQYLSPEQRVMWVFWGAEVYNRLPEFEDFVYGSLTRRHLPWAKKPRTKALKLSVGRTISGACGERIPWLFRRFPCTHHDFRTSLMRPQYLGLFLREDYDLVRARVAIPDHRVWYVYFNLEETVGASLMEAEVSGNGIFIGNSATPTNNHLEAFRALSSLDCSGHSVHVPLSYGVRSYGSGVIEQGRVSFGGTFHPMLKLVPREEYNRVILNCPIVIMNHHRQQAIGSILTSLWLGAKLYLSENCPTFRFLKRIGIHCYSVELDLVPGNRMALEPLSPDLRGQNREVLARHFAKERVYARMKAEFESILVLPG